MDHYGIRGKLLIWMDDFLSERTEQVVVTLKVPQGAVLGPFPLLININDLVDRVKSQIYR